MSTSLLIIDDSAFSRNMIKRNMPEGWDVDITEVDCGGDGLRACSAVRFEVIFLDLTMHDMDGLDFLLEYKKLNQTAKIFVISADIQTSSVETALARGALDFLAKPVDAVALEAMLKRNEVL